MGPSSPFFMSIPLKKAVFMVVLNGSFSDYYNYAVRGVSL